MRPIYIERTATGFDLRIGRSRTTYITLSGAEIAALKALLAHVEPRPEVIPTIVDTRPDLDPSHDFTAAGGPIDAPVWLPAGSTQYFPYTNRVRPWAFLRDGTFA